jgi:predicted transposase YbfD/YdcC
LAHRVGVTRAQQAVDDKTTAIPVVLALLRHRSLEGRLVTLDAWLPQRQRAQPMVAARGD